MTLLRFKALTFDVVGTLIDFEGGMIDYIRKTSKAKASALGDDAILEAYRRSRAAPASARYPDDLVHVYGDMARELGLPQGTEVAEGFRDSIKNWRGFPDSAEGVKR